MPHHEPGSGFPRAIRGSLTTPAVTRQEESETCGRNVDSKGLKSDPVGVDDCCVELLRSVKVSRVEHDAGDPAPLRWDSWRFAVAVAVLTIALCFFATFSVPRLFGVHQWLFLGDAVWAIKSAQWVSWGGVGNLYSANPLYISLPGYLFVLAPAVAVGDHYHWATSYPMALVYPRMLLAAAPVFFVSGATSILGADYLANTLGIARRRRRLIAVAIGLLVVLPTCAWAGHPEDLVAIALSCTSVALLLRRRFLGAPIVLSIAIMMQPWGGLLIPVVVAATPAGRRIRALVWSSALPGACAALLLALDFHGAFRSFLEQPMLGNGQHLPWWGLAGRVTMVQDGLLIPARLGSGTRSLAVVVAIVAAVVVWRKPTPSIIMIAASVVLLARGISETQFWCYYLAPAAVFMVLAAASSAPSPRRWYLGAVSALVAYSFAAAAYDAYSMPSFLALAILLACGAGFLFATRPLGEPRLEFATDSDFVELESGRTVSAGVKIA
jgi:hypothetical protein